jgi:hypothetical protein
VDYSATLDVLLGWIDSPVRATVLDSELNPILVLNGQLGRAPDSSEGEQEARFFCVGHDDPRDGADGFFLPAATFKVAHYDAAAPYPEQRQASLVVDLGATTMVIERDPVWGRSSF